jgi:type I restriction enzyme S subunit
MNGPKAYVEYRDSGIDWLGEVPVEWAILPAKSVLRERKVKSSPVDVHLTPSQTHGVLPQSEYMERTGNKVVLNLTGADAMRHVEPNDFISHLRSFQGGFEFSAFPGKVSAAYTVLEPLPLAAPEYFRWVFKSSRYVQALQTTTDQLRDGQSIRFAQVALLPLPVPDLASQIAIAAFLDRETAEIDEFIADQEELIGLLAERRAATISHAVAKGLDPTAYKKDSGIEWLGSVPEAWRLMPFARAVKFREGPGIGAIDFRDEGVPLIRIAGVRGRYATLDGCNFLDGTAVEDRWRRFQVKLGDLLVSASASMGTVSEVGPEVVGAVPYTGIIQMNPGPGLERDFLRLFLQSDCYVTQIDRLKTGSTIQHYGPEHLRQMFILVPPIDTQEIIVQEVHRRLSELDSTIADARRAIALSRERRAALISAAVTGKIDVREHGVVA